MADESDVGAALVQLINAPLYPNGLVGNPPLTVLNAPARVYRGWPNGDALDKDLAAGIFNISVYALNGMERNTTRYPATAQVGTLNPPTITLTLAGRTITLGGAPAAYTQNIGVFVGGIPYLVTVPANTSLTAAATLLAAAYAGASSSGPVVTIPGGVAIGALRTGGYATTVTETKRQQKQFQITFWCPNPDLRDQAAALVDAYLSGVAWFQTADGSQVRLIYARSMSNDAPEKELLFRRDLYYLAEYPTIVIGQAAQILTLEVGQSLADASGNQIAGPINSYA